VEDLVMNVRGRHGGTEPDDRERENESSSQFRHDRYEL
jgi:hypothetical protein